MVIKSLKNTFYTCFPRESPGKSSEQRLKTSACLMASVCLSVSSGFYGLRTLDYWLLLNCGETAPSRDAGQLCLSSVTMTFNCLPQLSQVVRRPALSSAPCSRGVSGLTHTHSRCLIGNVCFIVNTLDLKTLAVMQRPLCLCSDHTVLFLQQRLSCRTVSSTSKPTVSPPVCLPACLSRCRQSH